MSDIPTGMADTHARLEDIIHRLDKLNRKFQTLDTCIDKIERRVQIIETTLQFFFQFPEPEPEYEIKYVYNKEYP